MDIVITNPQLGKLNARVELSGSELIVHSRSGRDPNPDHQPAVELLSDM